MNRFSRAIFSALVLFSFLAMSCSQKEEMDSWETEMAKQLQAESVQLFHRNTSSTVNGVSQGTESYLQLDIVNSKVLELLEDNKRLKSKKSEEIKDIVLALPEISSFPPFDEFRLNVIEIHGVAFFNSTKSQTTTYKIH